MKNLEITKIDNMTNDSVDFYTTDGVILGNNSLYIAYKGLVNEGYTANEALTKLVNGNNLQIEQYIPKKQYIVNVTDIEWDTDGEEVNIDRTINNVQLPESIFLDEIESRLDQIIEYYISEWLSDTYGYCHKGFNYEIVS